MAKRLYVARPIQPCPKSFSYVVRATNKEQARKIASARYWGTYVGTPVVFTVAFEISILRPERGAVGIVAVSYTP
jgi:hypothetical protein